MFLKTLFLACFIERWPLNSIALMTSCGLLSTGGGGKKGVRFHKEAVDL